MMAAASFETFDAFLAMGGHGFYVWLSYALALGVVAYNIVAPLQRRRSFMAQQADRQRRADTARTVQSTTGRSAGDTDLPD